MDYVSCPVIIMCRQLPALISHRVNMARDTIFVGRSVGYYSFSRFKKYQCYYKAGKNKPELCRALDKSLILINF